jgi:hypothetical protein
MQSMKIENVLWNEKKLIWEKQCFATSLATHYISTPMNVIRQVAWVAKDATCCIYNHTLVQLIVI